jgi:D-arabinose 1-dehydrogenase-like Zn-dependent alcohol dehydrogenase
MLAPEAPDLAQAHQRQHHTDRHIWDGYFDLGGGKRFYVKERGCVPPFTLGHEPFGVVEALGPSATGVKVGDRRIVYPWIGCGACVVCNAGQDNYCLAQRFLGAFQPGAYASHLIIPHSRYLLDGDGIDESLAANLACSGLTVYSAIRKFPCLRERDWVIVLGCGGLGLVALSTLRALWTDRVIACDIDESKFAAARAAGAHETVNSRDVPAAVREIQDRATGAIAAALDFVGLPETFHLGTTALAKGGRYIMCGLFGGEVTLSLPPIVQGAIAIVGSYVGICRNSTKPSRLRRPVS